MHTYVYILRVYDGHQVHYSPLKCKKHPPNNNHGALRNHCMDDTDNDTAEDWVRLITHLHTHLHQATHASYRKGRHLYHIVQAFYILELCQRLKKNTILKTPILYIPSSPSVDNGTKYNLENSISIT